MESNYTNSHWTFIKNPLRSLTVKPPGLCSHQLRVHTEAIHRVTDCILCLERGGDRPHLAVSGRRFWSHPSSPDSIYLRWKTVKESKQTRCACLPKRLTPTRLPGQSTASDFIFSCIPAHSKLKPLSTLMII